MADQPLGTVTFLFTDVEGSTRLWEGDPDAMRAAMARHDALLEEAIVARGGLVFSRMGDGMAAVFVSATEAVRAAIDAQLALMPGDPSTGVALRSRMGLHTGPGRLSAEQDQSPPLNRCARLMGVAHGGQVLASAATAALVGDELPKGVELADLGEHRLRDLARPMQVFAVRHADLPRDFPPLLSLDAFPGNLPLQVSSFIGRDRELARVGAALDESRVVTLTGVGGVGKTRLALQVAADVLPGFRYGAWLCELAPVRNPDGVTAAVATVFEVAARSGQTLEETLVDFLRGKQLLVVLDNCEHLLDPVAALVETLERSCPHVSVLATSREGLGIDGERILAVPSLAAPPADAGPDAVAASDAVRLFSERAQAVKADFAVTVENAGAVAQVCRRLDGVPLAIELAASRAPAMNPRELAARLDRRFQVLAGGRRGAVERHQTLRATIDWSYDLLDEAERQLLGRLSVFSGGWALEAAETVCAGGQVDPAAVLDLMARLVARSLVVAEDQGFQTRYRLLETIRQYAEERLAERGETAELRRRHADYYTALAGELSEQMLGPGQVDFGRRLVAEQENLLATIGFAVDTGDADLAFRMLRGLRSPAFQLGYQPRFPIEAVVSLPGAPDHPEYPFGLAVAASLASLHGDRELASRRVEEALEAEERLGSHPDGLVEALTMGMRAADAMSEGAWAEAATFVRRAADYWRRTASSRPSAGSLANAAFGLSGAAVLYATAGDVDSAVPLATEGLALARRVGMPTVIAMNLAALASAMAQRDPAAARAMLRESIDLRSRLGYETTNELAQGVLVAARLQDWPAALELAERAVPHLHWVGDRPQLAGVLNVVARAVVDTDAHAAAVLQGAARRAAVDAAAPAPAGSGGVPRGAGPDRGASSDRHAGGLSPGVGGLAGGAAPAAGPGGGAGPGLIGEVRRETTARLDEMLGGDLRRRLREEGEAMDEDQACAYAQTCISKARAVLAVEQTSE